MTTNAADDYETIRRRMEELKAERDLALTGSSVPQPEEQKEPPSWGYGGSIDYCALKSMAHPSWPYAGTAHEWRGFVGEMPKPSEPHYEAYMAERQKRLGACRNNVNG